MRETFLRPTVVDENVSSSLTSYCGEQKTNSTRSDANTILTISRPGLDEFGTRPQKRTSSFACDVQKWIMQQRVVYLKRFFFFFFLNTFRAIENTFFFFLNRLFVFLQRFRVLPSFCPCTTTIISSKTFSIVTNFFLHRMWQAFLFFFIIT